MTAPGILDSLSHCPACDLRTPWAADVLRAVRWRAQHGAVGDVVPEPTPALLDGVLTVETEQAAVHADTLSRQRAEMDAARQARGR